ncbi:SDR family oxidoreductase [Arthrobacter sp. NPDC058097]|uniref:SDR family oxidoreductase n=1 Tax=Arthrobacter sp. NPDC058097 TaxID=3346340 RepID=UPI0036DC149A
MYGSMNSASERGRFLRVELAGEQVPVVGLIHAELCLHCLGDGPQLEACDAVTGGHLAPDHFLLDPEGVSDGWPVFGPDQGVDGRPGRLGVKDAVGGLKDVDWHLESRPDAASAREALDRLHPVGRVGRPADVGDLAVFLASDRSAFLTGETVVLDGGRTAKLPLP